MQVLARGKCRAIASSSHPPPVNLASSGINKTFTQDFFLHLCSLSHGTASTFCTTTDYALQTIHRNLSLWAEVDLKGSLGAFLTSSLEGTRGSEDHCTRFPSALRHHVWPTASRARANTHWWLVCPTYLGRWTSSWYFNSRNRRNFDQLCTTVCAEPQPNCGFVSFWQFLLFCWFSLFCVI